MRDTGKQKFIKLRIKQRNKSTLLILVDNTCKTPVIFHEGIPMSSKREEFGIGTASVQSIAARYGGDVQFEQKEGVFCASVLLKISSDM